MMDEGNFLRIPVATYRVQFNPPFTFMEAKGIIRYLWELGITDLYASPYFRAAHDSSHGYDIVDHAMLNPETGTEEEYDEFVAELKKFGMGQILDIVPNHMCITSKDNAWWMDVLENGPSSVFADYFDIDWEPSRQGLKDKVLLPFLGDHYGVVLERGELTLVFEEAGFFIAYYDHKFPIRPQTYAFILENKRSSLEETLLDDDPHLEELRSILTALKHLPAYEARDQESVAERRREKEIIKRRLWALYQASEHIKGFIDRNVLLMNGSQGDPDSFDQLDYLLREQAYTLSYWPVAMEEINYRRFFDINSLGAIRMENPAVFEEAHSFLFKLIKERKVTGLRIDHPDGLYNPAQYFKNLQFGCFRQMMLDHVAKLKEEVTLPYGDSYIESGIIKAFDDPESLVPGGKPFYIVGEKILTKSEIMPEEWPIFSTTGYVFLNSVNGIFVETANGRRMEDIYNSFTRARYNFQDMAYQNKKLIMEVAMASETHTLGRFLRRIASRDRHKRDFTLNSLTKAIVEVIACFPVYRTYIQDFTVAPRDSRIIKLSIAKAKRKNPALSSSVFDFLRDVLLLAVRDSATAEEKEEWLEFTMRFQQITGPVMAKGIEDTSFYLYNRLLSLNEVGGNPEKFGTTMETFHGQNIERRKFWPHALIATSTHDTKRNEDVRSRIDVLSEIPDVWRAQSMGWGRLNRRKKMVIDGRAVPDRNEEYFLYQTLVGAWPVGAMNDSDYDLFKGRIKGHMVKALREAKVNTSWINPNLLYEEAVMIFVDHILQRTAENEFLPHFLPFQKAVSDYGMYNSLSQTLLKITVPGVPDFYQGTEIWDFSLADPDNRRPVDYSVRVDMLAGIKEQESTLPLREYAKQLTVHKEDGRIKLYVTYKALNFRRFHRETFEYGEYIPLDAFGEKAHSICAFARRRGADTIIVAVPRLIAGPAQTAPHLPLGENAWRGTVLTIPVDRIGLEFRDIFSGNVVTTGEHRGVVGLKLAEVFRDLPVALLELTN
jgi:(1->4)-alpha-D-glucan 1-alpha-D-glucosylmutase